MKISHYLNPAASFIEFSLCHTQLLIDESNEKLTTGHVKEMQHYDVEKPVVFPKDDFCLEVGI